VSDTPTQLLDAVDAVIAEHGPSGVTVRRVGTQAGLSHTAAAHYFGDKPGLFTAYLTRAYDRVGAAIEAAGKATDDPHQAMLDAAAAYARFALHEPSAFSVLQRLELTRVDTAELWQARERAYFGITNILLRHQATGWAADRNIADLIATTWAFVHGFVELWVSGPLAAPYDGEELEPTLRRVFADLISALT
jgi:AcrR family transcriptional regulator